MAVDDLSERGCVFQPNAQILITRDVKDILMNKEDVTNNVAQVNYFEITSEANG